VCGCMKSWLFRQVSNQILVMDATVHVFMDAINPQMVGQWLKHGACMRAVDVLKASSAAFFVLVIYLARACMH
jgi:hypothetical protein